MKRVVLTAIALIVAFSGQVYSDGPGNIQATKHNLSSTGGQDIHATAVDRICVFCHTPHMAYTGTPLWNHTMSTRTSYTVYSSATLLSTPQNPPDGDSRLCLSCHDGDQPVGSVVNIGGQATTISMTGTNLDASGRLLGPTSFGADLSGHHPVSIEISQCLKDCKAQADPKGCPDPSVDWKLQPTIDAQYLKPTGNQFSNTADCSAYCTGGFDHPGVGVQCSSCHDAHTDNVNFLRAVGQWNPPQYPDALCQACHAACP